MKKVTFQEVADVKPTPGEPEPTSSPVADQAMDEQEPFDASYDNEADESSEARQIESNQAEGSPKKEDVKSELSMPDLPGQECPVAPSFDDSADEAAAVKASFEEDWIAQAKKEKAFWD